MNEDHAVTKVVFQLKLDEFVEPPALAEVAATDPGWKTALPALTALPPVAVEIGAGQTIEVPGIQSSIVRPDAKPIWALRLSGFEVTVECSAYTRWEDIWRQARGYLEQAYALVRRHQADANVLEMSLVVTDRFLTDDDSYTAGELFQAGRMIGDAILQRGGIWHCNTGWLEPDVPFRDLHSLNVQARGKRSSGGATVAPYAFSITHGQQASTPGEAIPVERLDEIVTAMHKSNKRVIGGLVVPDMLERIRLFP